MDPILLDVNVHPTKQEVRLSKEAELIRLIKEIIAERLSNYTYIPQGMNNVLTKKEKSRIEKLDFLSELDTKFGIEEDADISKKQLEDKIINEDDFIFGEDNLSSENNISVNDKNEIMIIVILVRQIELKVTYPI